MKKRKHYSKEIEAAWYTLKDFIHPLDCSYKGFNPVTDEEGQVIEVVSGVYPMNRNYVLASVLSGSSLFRPSYMSKSKLHLHLIQQKTYYYRSKYDAIHSEGYGSSDKQALNLEFSEELRIRSSRKKYEDKYNILLLGIDIDTHHGEPDAMDVEKWLRSEYFKESYWEPSSGLKGRHGYVKVAYPYDTRISEISDTFEELFKLLDTLRKQKNYLAPIDPPCGLPSQVILVDTNPYEAEIDEALSSDSGFQVDKSTLSINSRYIQLKRSQALKIPRFNQSNPHKCNMEDIIRFHGLRFYKFSYYEKLLNSLRNELTINIFGEGNDNNSDLVIPPTIVCSPPVNTQINKEAKEVKWAEISGNNNNLLDYWKNKSYNKKRLSYQQIIDELRCEQDTFERVRQFYWNYSVYLHRVPSPEEAMSEYLSQGLNSSGDLDSKKRLLRFQSCYKFIMNRFDLSKCGFHLDHWELDKHYYIQIVSDRISSDIDLKWSKDKNKSYTLKVEDIALIYFAIIKSNELDRNNVSLVQNSFSYKRIQSIFRLVYDIGCHRAKCNKILKVLRETGLVGKTGNYIAGVRGNCYTAKAV